MPVKNNQITPEKRSRTPSNTLSYLNATGRLRYTLTNDYLFRALLQKNNKVLKHLICSLKHLSPKEVTSVTIENPIVLGEAIDNKTFVLDIRVRMSDQSIINLEMQVLNQGDWTDRSLVYLCRCFDQLQKGQDYPEVKPVTHIGFVDFTLFPEVPEFFATYQILNLKNYHKYSDKFTINVIDLTRINLATEEDKEWRIDHWASLFKATTWEEIILLAENNEVLQEAADTIYQLSQEERIREQCQAREDYERMWGSMNRRVEHLTEENAGLRETLSERDAENAELKKELDRLKQQLAAQGGE